MCQAVLGVEEHVKKMKANVPISGFCISLWGQRHYSYIHGHFLSLETVKTYEVQTLLLFNLFSELSEFHQHIWLLRFNNSYLLVLMYLMIVAVSDCGINGRSNILRIFSLLVELMRLNPGWDVHSFGTSPILTLSEAMSNSIITSRINLIDCFVSAIAASGGTAKTRSAGLL